MNKDVEKMERLADGEVAKERREFLKKAGKFGITAPMAALLLSVNSKRASAGATVYERWA